MNLQEAMTRLEEYGTEQNRKVYQRHGASANLFGVSFANLKVLKKEIKKDQELAEQLWATGNEDARTLATMIADPKLVSAELAEEWVHSTSTPVILDYVAALILKNKYAGEKVQAWTADEDEWVGRAGWSLLNQMALHDAKLPDEFFLPYLEQIRLNIHTSRNRKKEGMHTALLSIGMRNDALEEQVLRVVREIGPVDIDHGETGCKTPDPVEYIGRAKERKQKKVKA